MTVLPVFSTALASPHQAVLYEVVVQVNTLKESNEKKPRSTSRMQCLCRYWVPYVNCGVGRAVGDRAAGKGDRPQLGGGAQCAGAAGHSSPFARPGDKGEGSHSSPGNAYI